MKYRYITSHVPAVCTTASLSVPTPAPSACRIKKSSKAEICPSPCNTSWRLGSLGSASGFCLLQLLELEEDGKNCPWSLKAGMLLWEAGVQELAEPWVPAACAPGPLEPLSSPSSIPSPREQGCLRALWPSSTNPEVSRMKLHCV